MVGKSSSKLWTKNFIIITAGSAVSLLGNSITGFAMSLFVLDITDSSFYYALYLFLYSLPQLVAPMIGGPLADRFSRRRMVYLLDFCASAVCLLLSFLLMSGYFSFWLFSIFILILGTIKSFYRVAFNSFYPMLVSESQYARAYSVSSSLEALSWLMLPVAAMIYNSFGLAPILLLDCVSFLTAAIFETQITDIEKKNGPKWGSTYTVKVYLRDIHEGFTYLCSEKGLLLITVCLAATSLTSGVSDTVTLPWFRGNFEDGEYVYMLVWGLTIAGRLLGAAVRYKIRILFKENYYLALICHIGALVFEGIYLYFSLNLMPCLCFAIGFMGMISLNIHTAVTQAYVPNKYKGRYNGVYLMATTTGTLLGELLSGLLTQWFSPRIVLSLFMCFGSLTIFLLLAGGKTYSKPIYDHSVSPTRKRYNKADDV